MHARSLGGFAVAAAIGAVSLAPVLAQRGGGVPQPPDNAPTPRMADGSQLRTGGRAAHGISEQDPQVLQKDLAHIVTKERG